MVQFPYFINPLLNHSERLFGCCLLAGAAVEGALGNPTRVTQHVATKCSGAHLNVLPCQCQPREMAEGSSCATLLHLQGGHLGLVGHLSPDRGVTEHKNRTYEVPSCRDSLRVRGCLGSPSSEQSGCCSMWTLLWSCIDLAL